VLEVDVELATVSVPGRLTGSRQPESLARAFLLSSNHQALLPDGSVPKLGFPGRRRIIAYRSMVERLHQRLLPSNPSGLGIEPRRRC